MTRRGTVLSWRSVRRALTIATLTGLLHPSLGSSQMIHGRVVDSTTGLPIPGAILLLLTGANIPIDSLRATDSAGQFRLRVPGRDEYRVSVTKPGYISRTSNTLFVGPKDDIPLDIKLAAGTASPPPNLALLDDPGGFEARRAKGKGSFWTGQEIMGRGFNDLGQFFSQLPGSRMACESGGTGCRLILISGMSAGMSACPATFFVNGRMVPRYSDPYATSPEQFVTNILIGTVIGVEVYTTNASMPSIYAADARCGAVGIWTTTR